MARIIFPDGTEETSLQTIQATLAPLHIALKSWPTPESARPLLDKAALDEEEKAQLLASVEHRFEELKNQLGYTTRDMIVLHENVPGLDEIMAKFESIHTHDDDEVRYIVAGKGYFGFVNPVGEQFLVEVTAGDYINVPANTEHWFTLGDSTRIKAVRYFIDSSGWTPHYTQREMQFNDSNLPWAAA